MSVGISGTIGIMTIIFVVTLLAVNLMFLAIYNTLQKTNGGFRTKKTDRFLHGIGLRSISRIVAKYHGVATMYYDPENK